MQRLVARTAGNPSSNLKLPVLLCRRSIMCLSLCQICWAASCPCWRYLSASFCQGDILAQHHFAFRPMLIFSSSHHDSPSASWTWSLLFSPGQTCSHVHAWNYSSNRMEAYSSTTPQLVVQSKRHTDIFTSLDTQKSRTYAWAIIWLAGAVGVSTTLM